MATIETTYLGNLRTEITHVQSGDKVLTDAPTDNNGLGAHIGPTDMVAAALGSCIMTIMAMSAERHGADLTGTRLVIDKTMATDPRRIGQIKVDIHFPRDYDDRTKTILRNAADTCPVAKSLHPDLRQIVNFHFGK
jgi:uncharacterized OsmC-like protein